MLNIDGTRARVDDLRDSSARPYRFSKKYL
jgi:hypothetical protein